MSGLGKITVLVMVGVALAVSAWTVWFQHQRSRDVLDFWGPDAARMIAAAPNVEIATGSATHSGSSVRIGSANGMQNIRHALIQSETFLWKTRTPGALADWDYELRFGDVANHANVRFSVSSGQIALEGGTTVVTLHPKAGKELRGFCEEQFANK